MSGILGIWNSQKPSPWQAMLDDLTLLGHDSQGEWHDSTLGLSLGRTQFYDTPESQLEPPVVQAEGCVLVWDGRLDDREPLLAGRSLTDAQLLIESYRRWGVDCLQHLVGEYAFILWDAASDRLLVGCDPAGGRAIAYFWNGETLLVSSRALSLLLHPQVSPALNEQYVAHVLCDLWAQPPGITPFAAIQRLRPGWALILESGRLQQREIAKFILPHRYPAVRSPHDCFDQFWDLLNRAVKDRLRSIHPACATLSGGLDSTTVTVSLLRHRAAIDAFSYVTQVHPEFDEREPIRSFLRMYPQVNWHPIDMDDLWKESEPWDQLPATDDPFSISILPMHLRSMAQIRQAGFGLVFEGEGGDELFCTAIQDQVRGKNWRQVLHQLRSQRWHSTLWWEFAVPNLPQAWQPYWLRRTARVAHPLPDWILPTYAQTAEVQAALQQAGSLRLAYDHFTAVTVPLSYGGFVGGTQAYRAIAAQQGLQYVAPLQDQRLIEFALHLPPALQADPHHEKIFLRQATHATLPEDVRWRPKENYFDPIKYAKLGRNEQVLALSKQIKNCAYLQDIVDFDKLEEKVNFYRSYYANSYSSGQVLHNALVNNLYALLEFSLWYEKMRSYQQQRCASKIRQAANASSDVKLQGCANVRA